MSKLVTIRESKQIQLINLQSNHGGKEETSNSKSKKQKSKSKWSMDNYVEKDSLFKPIFVSKKRLKIIEKNKSYLQNIIKQANIQFEQDRQIWLAEKYENSMQSEQIESYQQKKVVHFINSEPQIFTYKHQRNIPQRYGFEDQYVQDKVAYNPKLRQQLNTKPKKNILKQYIMLNNPFTEQVKQQTMVFDN